MDRLVQVLAAAPERVILQRGAEPTRGRQLLEAIHRYARVLESRDIGRGDVVAIFAVNGMESLAIRYAANLVGAGACFLSVPSTSQARAELIAAIHPRLLVVFPESAALVPCGCTLPVAGIGTAPPNGFDLKAAASDVSPAPMASRGRPKDLAVIISSGGSTGVPKGSWRTFEAYARMVAVASPRDRRQLVNGPLAYLSQVLVDVTLLGGGTVVFQDRYDAAKTASAIERERITDLFLVEPQLFDLMDHPCLAGTDLSSLRTLTHIGASAPPSLRRRARERFGPRVVHVYGASEEGLVSALAGGPGDASADDFHSAGHVLPGVEVRLRREDGTLASAGEAGCIEVRSPAMAQGYRNRPDLEAQAFRDGWYRSGDLARLDIDGTLQILGRAVDIAFVDGRMVSPTSIEDALCGLPDVRYACVVREAHIGRWIALVLPHHGVPLDLTRCRRAVAARHGPGVADSVVWLTPDHVPLTPQGKPDREAIRALAAEGPVPA
ncbi:fatty-acyl-CoA synthase [Variovorax sp. OV329]|nr:fatty-acyl-CoA synthase [Variovorax sp. OV329]